MKVGILILIVLMIMGILVIGLETNFTDCIFNDMIDCQFNTSLTITKPVLG